MHAARGIAIGHGFDHASNLASEFGRNAGGVGLDRLHIVEIVGGRERGRAVVEDGEAVDNILRVIFGAARMDDSVGLEHPAGLRLDDVDRLASGNGGGPIAQRGCAELVSVAGVRGVEQRVGIFYVDGLGDGGDGEHDGNFLGQLGANLDQRIVGSESGVLEGQVVGAQRQLLGGVFAGGSGVEREFEMACLADEKAVGGQDGAVGIGDGEAEFAGAILRAGQRGTQQEQKCGVDQGR